MQPPQDGSLQFYHGYAWPYPQPQTGNRTEHGETALPGMPGTSADWRGASGAMAVRVGYAEVPRLRKIPGRFTSWTGAIRSAVACC